MTMIWDGLFGDQSSDEAGHGYAGKPLPSPTFFRVGLATFRALLPIAQLGKTALVTRFADVEEVLTDHERFHVRYTNKMKRTTGAFILGMNEDVPYQAEAKYLRAAVHPGDLDRVRALTREFAGELLERGLSRGQLDVVSDYARKLAVRVSADYLGVSGPCEHTLSKWTQALFLDLFLNLKDDRRLSALAVDAATDFCRHLEARADKLRSDTLRGVSSPDTVFARLLQLQATHDIDDTGVRRNIAGLVIGAIDTVAKAVVLSFDQLLARPVQLEEARAAARLGDVERVAKYTFEALRFNPHNPIVLRIAERDTVLAQGTRREHRVKAGDTVVAATMSAMFDRDVFRNPTQFSIDRDATSYMHFGRGRHQCFGEHLVKTILPEAVMALLSCPDLTRAPGKQGRVCGNGYFPDRMLVRLRG
jgi:cytochrome P450